MLHTELLIDGEGDLDNARYWYRRIRRAFPGRESVEREIALARQAVERGTEAGTL